MISVQLYVYKMALEKTLNVSKEKNLEGFSNLFNFRLEGVTCCVTNNTWYFINVFITFDFFASCLSKDKHMLTFQ